MGPVGPPEMPSGRIVVEPPPALDEPEGTGTVLTSTVPMVGSLGSLAVVATMSSQSGGGHRSMLAAAVFLVATLAFVVVQVDRQRTRRVHHLTRSRRGYLRHLAEVRARVRQASAEQELALLWHHPSPEVLPAVVTEGSRVWERTGAHPWAGRLRYAVGDLPPAVELVGPGPGSGDDPDPFAVDALRRLLAAHGRTHGVPLTLELATTRAVQVSGTPETARSLVRAVLSQAVAFHPPDDLVVAVLAADDALRHWEWVKWLPHAHSRTCRDAVGARRLVADSAERLAELVSDRSGRLLLVVDGIRLPSEHPWSRGEEGVTRLEVGEGDAPDPPDRDVLRLRVFPGSRDPSLAVVDRSGEPTATGTADQCGVATAEALARRLLPLRPLRTGRSSGQGPLAALVAGSLASDVPWPSRPGREQLRVPIGTEDDGSTVHLDLKEAARQGAGPHGLVVGATGSGKSELLRTLVLGLAATHSPEDLNLVLVDFKGGATFAGLAPLPHVSGLVTNLADDLALVDRVQDALVGEVVRRQELLHATGPFASAHDHRRAREAGADLAPLPSLLVVVDEFSELLAARPEFLDVFTSIGRLGRSLGIHLVLASQRLEEGRLRGLESHLSYRVALRTFTTSESRAVLGVPDAAELPPAPGVGYLRTGPSRPVRFRATYVSGPAAAPVRRARRPVAGPFTAAEVPVQDAPADPAATPAALLDAVVARLADRGPRARRIWHPPLGRPDPLGELVGRLDRHPDLGLVAIERRGRPLRVPIGVVDRPLHQRRDLLEVDLSAAGGHVAVVGGPRSGRSTLLQTLTAGLALTSTPAEAQVLVLDLAGGGWAPLGGLPHVVSVATRTEPDAVGAAVAEARHLLDRREAWFGSHGVEDVEEHRRRLRDGGHGDGRGEVFLVVDGWTTLRSDHEELEPELHRIAERGLALGVHLVVAASRWSDLRPRTRDLFGTRLEMRLGDPLDSEVDRRRARLVPPDRPGRGLTADGSHFLSALPALTREGDLAGLVAEVAQAWSGPPAPRLRPLPDQVELADVRETHGAAGPGLLLLGVDERWAPVTLDPAAEPHLLVLGRRGSGRTTALRALLREVARTRAPEQAQVVLVDPRRSLLGEVPAPLLLAHHASEFQARPALTELAEHLHGRLPGPDVTAEQLRSRSWWKGAEVFVVVDDHELVAPGGRGSPLTDLLPLLPRARDVGLHLFLARSSGGAARALHEPALQALRDLATPTLLLPGNPDEGPVVGRLTSRPGPPGRGRLARGDDGVRTVQVAWTSPA